MLGVLSNWLAVFLYAFLTPFVFAHIPDITQLAVGRSTARWNTFEESYIPMI
jgi:hypothetical protein